MKAPEHQAVRQLATLHEVSQVNQRLYRAFLLREELRLLYHLPDPGIALFGPADPGPGRPGSVAIMPDADGELPNGALVV